jgi:uncharacterized protein YjbK
MDSTWIECSYFGRRRQTPMSMSDNGPSKFEFKVTVLPEQVHLVRAQLEKQGAGMRLREVYFYDTPGLELKDRKLFLRARTTEGEKPDSTVKLRPLQQPEIPKDWKDVDYRYESDVIGDEDIPSLKLDRPEGEIDKHDVGGEAKTLFDKDQRDLVEIDWDELKPFGPVHAHLWELEYDALPKELSVEEWTVPGGPHFIELSFKVKANEKAAAKQAFHALLDGLGINPKGDPDPKTTRVLEFFAKKLG